MGSKAISLYEKMKELNFSWEYSCSAEWFNEAGSTWEDPWFIRRNESKQYISPDKFTYGILMNSYALSNEIEAAEMKMKEVEIILDGSEWSFASSGMTRNDA